MRSLRFLLLVLLFVLPWPAAAAPLDEVRKSFLDYKTAILTADGDAAAAVVTRDSQAYFRQLADQALTLDRDALHRIHLSDRIYAMLLRHSLEAAELQRMSGSDVVSFAVDEGWIGKEGASRLQLGNYQVEGDAATGTILQPDGSETPFKMQFVREEGRWLLDLVALMHLTRTAFEYAVQQSGLGEDEFVLLMLEQGTGRKPGPEIWSPPS
ncbi:MAG: hypothetical protein ACFCUT_16875 [Kiloniellaceae bacterium]